MPEPEKQVNEEDERDECDEHAGDLIERLRESDVADEPPEKPTDDAHDYEGDESGNESGSRNHGVSYATLFLLRAANGAVMLGFHQSFRTITMFPTTEIAIAFQAQSFDERAVMSHPPIKSTVDWQSATNRCD
jgi:hypothetical protein